MNVGGPVLMIFFLEMKVAPLVLVQAINLAFFVSKIAQAGTFAVLGYFGLDLLLWSLPLALISLAGLRAGMALRDRVPADRFRGWLRGLLWLMAGMLVVQFLPSSLGNEGEPAPNQVFGAGSCAIKLLRRLWAGVEIALGQVATELAQGGSLGLGLYALGDHRQRQHLPQLDHRGGDGGRVAPMLHAVDEASVQLQHRDRESAQVGQRGVAGAEVVDGQETPSSRRPAACARRCPCPSSPRSR